MVVEIALFVTKVKYLLASNIVANLGSDVTVVSHCLLKKVSVNQVFILNVQLLQHYAFSLKFSPV